MKEALSIGLLIVCLAFWCAPVRAQEATAADRNSGPTGRTFGVAEKILGYDAPPPGPPTEESARRERAAIQYPGNSAISYRGVVFDNFNATGGYGEEMAVDFGGAGVWVRDGAWQQISGLNAEWLISGLLDADNSDAELIAGFGNYGVWVWEGNGTYPGTWTQVSGRLSFRSFITDDDGDGLDEVYIDFGSIGLWRLDYVGVSWTQLSSLNPNNGLRMDTQVPGHEEACASFPTYGIWRFTWSGGAPVVSQLSGTVTSDDDHASARFTGGSAEDLVIDFAGLGLWLLKEDDHSWHSIDSGSVNRVREVYFGGDPDAELLIMYNSAPTGLWIWDYAGFPGSLTRLNAWTTDSDGFVEPFDLNGNVETNGDQELAVDFGANGLWIYDNTDQSWVQISALDPVFMVAGDYWNIGYKNTLAVDFGATYGFWRYTATTGDWEQLSSLSPENSSE